MTQEEIIQKATAQFERGYSCSQSVFSAFAPALGVAEEQALQTAAMFGGGIGHTGRLCGALSGALMALGLRYGNTTAGDRAAKERDYTLAQELMQRFQERHGTSECRELLGIDIRDEQQYQQARQQGLFKTRCPLFVGGAAQLLHEMLAQDIQPFLEQVSAWAAGQEDILALALIGSHARGAARLGSDIDLLILAEQPQRYLQDTAWAAGFGRVLLQREEDYGLVTSLRLWYADGREVEYCLAGRDWAAPPLDAGTAEVIAKGMRVLFERGTLLSPLVK
jgi:C_GCAxxG_C_C family probable redox protein